MPAAALSQPAGGRVAAQWQVQPAAGPSSLAAARLPAPRRSRTSLRPEAFAQPGCAPGQRHDDGTYERVLRYPNGDERRIRYPLPPSEDLRSEDLTDGCWADSCWEPRAQWLGLAGGAGGDVQARAAAATAAVPQQAPAPGGFLPQQQPPAEPERSQLPASPMELLRYLNSPEYQRSQEEVWARVRGSYEVLDAVPWVAPRPLYLLATEQQEQPSASAAAAAAVRFGADAAPGQTYTLRTRVAKDEMEDELSRLVLRRRAADGSPLIRCSEMKDGVVAFEDEADAERYGELLEADGSAQVSVARCDSHELFRTVQDVRAVVVLLRRQEGPAPFLPQPHQLATSLRRGEEAGGSGASGQPLFD